MTTFTSAYFKKESAAQDKWGNPKKYPDRHEYASVLELANSIARFQNASNQQCAKVLIDLARLVQLLEAENTSHTLSESIRYEEEQRFSEQMHVQTGGY